MRRLLSLFCILLLLTACSAPLVPPATNPAPARQQLSDADLLVRLRHHWKAMERGIPDAAARARTVAAYNADLLLLLRRLRHDSTLAGELRMLDALRVRVQVGGREVRPLSVFDDVVPAADIPLDSLEERYTLPGIGVPMVGIIPYEKAKLNDRELNSIGTRGTVSTLTAVLRFPKQGRPELLLLERSDDNWVRAGRYRYQLAADWSAPLEMYWNLTRVKEDRLLGLLRPQELRDTTGLTSIHPYEPDKIPVILTHGLASSAGTFDNLVNRLLNDPVIRRNYQFWYFNYPTGIAWTISARAYRDSIRQLREKVDPLHRNPNWERMVVVGHSMGGLITHYSQCTEPWNLLRASRIPEERLMAHLHPRHRDIPFADARLEPLRQDYFFHPVQAGLVVYMATPHRGAPLATSSLVTFLSKLVTLPKYLIQEAYNMATLQQDMLILNPQHAYQWFTSLNQLKPGSYSIRGLQGLRVRSVQTHSIIGDRGCATCPQCSDGVVPYWSSHINWGSETIVPAHHSVQDSKEAAADMQKILDDYARKVPAVRLAE